MKLAYVTFEYPPDTAYGGIATYMRVVAEMMADRGHLVEVFCASPKRTVSEQVNGVLLHRIQCDDRRAFSKVVLPPFIDRQRQLGFDLMESAEFSGDALEIKKALPAMPLVVKLQTPWYLIDELSNHYFKFYNKLRYVLGGFLKGEVRKWFWRYDDYTADPDYQITRLANQVQSPSVSLGTLVTKKWKFGQGEIITLPAPFIPDNKLLEIPVSSKTRVVSYIGRLERRKGLIELAKALPHVFDAVPDFNMRFVGSDYSSHMHGYTMRQYLEKVLAKYINRIEFKLFASDAVHNAYAETDICIFPSLWENFPNVCLEAMSAGRGVIGSKFGGMSDMIEPGTSGLLIDPLKPTEVSTALIKLLRDDELRMKLGYNARVRVLKAYNQEVIGSLMEEYYQLAINN